MQRRLRLLRGRQWGRVRRGREGFQVFAIHSLGSLGRKAVLYTTSLGIEKSHRSLHRHSHSLSGNDRACSERAAITRRLTLAIDT